MSSGERKWNTMIDVDDLVKQKREEYGIKDSNFKAELANFFVSNNWFGHEPTLRDGKVFFTDEMMDSMKNVLDFFCSHYGLDDEAKAASMLNTLKEVFPRTAELFRKYEKKTKPGSAIALRIIDFLCAHLVGELPESTDHEVELLLDKAFDELQHDTAVVLAGFVNWVHKHARTVYKKEYSMNKYADRSQESAAYDQHHYLEILFHIYNEKYIEENNMYALAADSKNYVDTWLYLALHFLCALRNTDLLRIPHPRLVDSPERTLTQIREGTFPASSAKVAVYSVVDSLQVYSLTPNKTRGTSGVGSIKLVVPTSVEDHIGTLFAAAEAHFQLSGKSPEEPLIRVITSYQDISRYMGDEIGDLFLKSNFRARSANKAYMQMIYLLTDEILEDNDEFHVKGYILASLARSHKGSYGEFAQTTSVYLKDAKMSGFTPEFVARELFERGVLSFVPEMLLKMIGGDTYRRLSVENQTKANKEFGISPLEAEKSVAVAQKSMKQSMEIVNTLYQTHEEQDVIKILHRIGNGEAVSKTGACMCLKTAMGKMCPKPECPNCLSCEYEISTKTTMMLMAREVNRLKKKFQDSDLAVEKLRCKNLAEEIVVPCIEEMLTVMYEKYGAESVKALELIIAQENENVRESQ